MAATDLFTNLAGTTVITGGTTAPAGGTIETWLVAASTGWPAVTNLVSQFKIVEDDSVRQSEVMAVTDQGIASLTTALVTATVTTTLAVSALSSAVAAGDSIRIGTGVATQTVVASALAAIAATSISVTSFTTNAAYPIGTLIVDVTTPGASRTSWVVTRAAEGTASVVHPSGFAIVSILSTGVISGLRNEQPSSLPVSQFALLSKRYVSSDQTYNISESSLRNSRINLAGVKAADTAGPVFRIVMAGDSRSQGTGGGLPLYANCYGAKLRALLNYTFGLRTTDGAVWATDAGPFDDARIVQGTGWSITNGKNTGKTDATAFGFGGGGVFFAGTTATGTLQFNPDRNMGTDGITDTLRVFYLTNSGGGTVTVRANGVSLGTINTGSPATPGEAVATFTATRGNNAYNVDIPTVGGVQLIGFEAYDSTNPCISISNCGTSGATTTSWTTTQVAQGSAGMWSLYKPHLTFMPLGINDSNSAIGVGFITAAQYQANLVTVVNQCRATAGDMILFGDYQSSAAGQTNITPFVQGAYNAADITDSCLFDLNSRWPAGTGAQLGVAGYGLVVADLVHPSPRGHFEIADGLAQLLIEALATGFNVVSPNKPVLAQVTTAQTMPVAATDVTGLTATATFPAGRRIRLSASIGISKDTTAGGVSVRIMEGATVLQQAYQSLPANEYKYWHPFVVISPSAGTHTYKVNTTVDATTAPTNVSAAGPAQLLIEDIGAV